MLVEQVLSRGHRVTEAGDGEQVLRVVAGRLRAAARPGDVPGRWGGEEFLIVLPGTGGAAAAGPAAGSRPFTPEGQDAARYP